MKIQKGLPQKPQQQGQILKRLENLSSIEDKFKDEGMYSGSTYMSNDELRELASEAQGKFLFTNILFYDAHSPSRQLENEVISMVLNLYKGSFEKGQCGLTTSGGSESILLGCLAHKKYYEDRRGIIRPEIILPETAHAAFFKACEMLEIKMRVLKINKKTFRVSASQYRKQINKNTIMMVVSTPNFPYGQIDPVTEVGALGISYDIGVFMDACLGGF